MVRLSRARRGVERAFKRCEALGCTKQAVFGVEPKVARWCASHAPEEAWNVKSKRCEALGCTKRPNFGVEPGVARWCAAHAPEGAWDVKHKRCEALGARSILIS